MLSLDSITVRSFLIRENSHAKDYSLLMQIGGAIYQTRSTRRKSKSTKWHWFQLFFLQSKLLMDLLLGGCLSLNPYLLGKLKRT